MIKTLLNIGIRAGLSDRDAFVKEVSSMIQDYQKDPETAQKWATGIAGYLEKVSENISMQAVIKGALNDTHLPDSTQVDRLTAAIENLTQEMQKAKAGK